MTIEEMKQMHLIDYLSKLGHHPDRRSGNSYWYRSPFRDEKTPSFKINRQLNLWYDFGTGNGGNIIDFGIKYFDCTVSDLLNRSETRGYTIVSPSKPNVPHLGQEDNSNRIIITSEGPIESFTLRKYLEKRRIPLVIADRFCKEVRYNLKGKQFFALGFKNDSGGYELRNEYFKAGSSPKDTTFIDNAASEVAVFEGFFNFLSYKSIFTNQQDNLQNFLVLNSVSFFEKSLSKMQAHNKVHLYLDQDKAGLNSTQKAIAIDKGKFIDQRHLYKHYNDLNDYLVHFGQTKKHSLNQRH